MSMVEAINDGWTPDNWQQRAKERRERMAAAARDVRQVPDRPAKVDNGPAVNFSEPVFRNIGVPQEQTQVIGAPKGTVSPRVRDFLFVASEFAPDGEAHFVPESFNEMNVREIIKYICALRNIKKDDLIGPRRSQIFVQARHETYHLLKGLGRYSYPEIGRQCGGRDHSTIIHGAAKHERLLKEGKVQPTPFNKYLAAECCRGTIRRPRAADTAA